MKNLKCEKLTSVNISDGTVQAFFLETDDDLVGRLGRIGVAELVDGRHPEQVFVSGQDAFDLEGVVVALAARHPGPLLSFKLLNLGSKLKVFSMWETA